jgi:hypothetical protein
LLGAGQIARLEVLSQCVESLGQAIPGMMMVMVAYVTVDVLCVLLHLGILLLGRRQISGLQVFPQRFQVLHQRVVIVLECAWNALGQSSKVLLRLGQIAGLQILAKLPKIVPRSLQPG